MDTSKSLFETAQQHIPGGVNSPVRAFKAVGGDPVFFASGKGPILTDVEGKTYIDYVNSWGAMILGHAHPDVLAAVAQTMENGLSFGAPTAIEVDMAEEIIQLMPNIEMIRMVNSGTEATLSAIRVARGFTKRDKILKFEGCYHGHHDALLVKAGSGALTFGTPTSPGIPEACTKDTLTADYNNLEQVQEIFSHYGNDIATIIVEPVAGNMNCIPAKPEFLQGLRQLCDEYGSLLIFDEVMTGFRVALGGAQQHYQIKPDLTTLGKVIGGGLPVGAFGGRKDIMQQLAPLGPIYQAGTLSGNPMAMSAGLTQLKAISKANFYQDLTQKTKKLVDGLQQAATDSGIALRTNQAGSMFGFFFTAQDKLESLADVTKCDLKSFNQFFHEMLSRGIYLAPSAFEAGFMSAAHTDEHIDKTIQAAQEVFAKLNST